MKLNIALIYVFINLSLINFCSGDNPESDSNVPDEETKVQGDEDENKLVELGDELEDDKRALENNVEEVDGADERQLKAKRSKKNTNKGLRRSKAIKKGKKPKQKKGAKRTKKSKPKKKNKKNKKSKKNKNKKSKNLKTDPPIDPENEKATEEKNDPELDAEENPVLPELDTDETSLPELTDEEILDTQLDNSLDKTKRYWDSEILEPQHVINEWLAISDGKKYDSKSAGKFPFSTDDENDYDRYYLSQKLKKSRSSHNKYASGSKFKSEEGLNTNYVMPVIIDGELLRLTHPDTREDELENMIINKKFKQNYGNQIPNQGTMPDEMESGSGSYDLQESQESYSPESMGTYSKLDPEKYESNYGETIPNEDAERSVDYENNLGTQGSGNIGDNAEMTESDMSEFVSGQEDQLNGLDSINQGDQTENDSEWPFADMDVFDEQEGDEGINTSSKKDCKKMIKEVKKSYETKLKQIKKLASR
ncbi:uncharacterized protein TA19365 [Theileria annulata]|uniref:Uncharacterized protein n=1 Tax=Theileria annulata TaxID=5874 RepID=Q4UGE4_THEAN|nr:uncharacterized protein TA19365 [Theileria annulata]CAI73845.1 hypothetical protein TA19365 [Theileria annulata]|eukprot:XP_954522.1 hypothetical protein TA19365 [Theileria annulata]